VSEYKSKHDLEKAIKANDTDAIFVLVSRYATGEGEKFDPKKALELFEKSAQLGSSNAMLQLGLIQSQTVVAAQLYGGDGVKKDIKVSFKWILKAAEQGDIESQNNVGLAYERGEGVEQDPLQALVRFKRAADHGHALAQYNTALKYYNGADMKQNLDESIQYAEMAVGNGNSSAKALLYDIYTESSSLKYNPEKANYWKSKI